MGHWTHFKDVFGAADRSIPKVILVHCERSNWLSEEALHLIHKKKRSCKLAKRTGKDEDINRYRNRVHDLTRRDHRENLENITNNLHNDQRPFWKWLKRIKQVATGHSEPYFSGQSSIKGKDVQPVLQLNFYWGRFVKCGQVMRGRTLTPWRTFISAQKLYLKELRSIDVTKARWEIGGELTCPNWTSPHVWGTILHTIPLHISYKYLISPCCGQWVTGRYGCLDVTILTKYPLLRENSDSKSSSLLQHLPQYAR